MTTTATVPTISSTSSSTRAKIAGGPTPEEPFPIKMSGTVIKGFGRGSKELGIPTANLPEESVDAQGHHMETGIYYGWAQVVVKNKPKHNNDHNKSKNSLLVAGSASSSTASLATHCPAIVYPMVMSLGWNPFYKNEKKSAEVHIMHNFHRDFYGDDLRVVVLGYIRPEFDYTTLDALIKDINIDIEVAHRSLERPDYAIFKEDPLFLHL
ncbi:riboflavin kinase [Mortierella polycephala]|uniref:Riboflavin kinase n=1 Tax=Mortierella polycephala TaxID=41804 RepID=A0A9P6QE65_9FUNG|nr:riboflavin kinase [Mortierella polycephala]